MHEINNWIRSRRGDRNRGSSGLKGGGACCASRKREILNDNIVETATKCETVSPGVLEYILHFKLNEFSQFPKISELELFPFEKCKDPLNISLKILELVKETESIRTRQKLCTLARQYFLTHVFGHLSNQLAENSKLLSTFNEALEELIQKFIKLENADGGSFAELLMIKNIKPLLLAWKNPDLNEVLDVRNKKTQEELIKAFKKANSILNKGPIKDFLLALIIDKTYAVKCSISWIIEMIHIFQNWKSLCCLLNCVDFYLKRKLISVKNIEKPLIKFWEIPAEKELHWRVRQKALLILYKYNSDIFTYVKSKEPDNRVLSILTTLQDGKIRKTELKCRPTNCFFYGRESEIAEINKELAINNRIIITGVPGIGKTALATAYVSKYHTKYSRVFWIDAESQESIDDGFIKVGVDLKINERNMESLLKRIIIHTSKSSYLIVFDNAFPGVKQYISQFHCLVTSNYECWTNFPVLVLREFDQGTSLNLLRSVHPQDNSTPILTEFYNIPRSIVQKGSYFRLNSCADSLHASMIKSKGIVEVTLSALYEQSLQSIDLLHILALIHPAKIPEQLYKLSLKNYCEGLSEFKFVKARDILKIYSFIHVGDRNEVSLESNVVSHIYKDTKYLESITTAFTEILSQIDRIKDKDTKIKEFLAIQIHAIKFIEYFEANPLDKRMCFELVNLQSLVTESIYELPQHYLMDNSIDMRICDLIGRIFYLKGMNKEAMDNLSQALTMHIRELGNEHEDTINIFISIGKVYFSQNKFAKALDNYKNVLSTREKQNNQGDIAPVLDIIGLLYKETGKFPDSLEYFQRSLDIYQSIGETAKAALILYNIGLIHKQLNNNDLALEHLSESKELYISLYEEEHPTVADLCNDIALVYDKLNNEEESLFHFQKALSIKISLYGEDFYPTAVAFNNLGIFYINQKKHSEAYYYLEKAYKIVSKENKVLTADILRNIALVYKSQEQYETSIEHFQFSLNIYKDNNQFNLVGHVLSDLASVYECFSMPKEALEYHFKAFNIYNNVKNYEKMAEALSDIGEIQIAQEEYLLARGSFNEAIQYYKQVHGETCVEVAGVLSNLASVHSHEENFEESLNCFSSALKIYTYLNDQTGVFDSLNNIGLVHYKKEEYEKSLTYYLQALDIKEDISCLNNIANTYQELNYLKKALNIYERVLELLKEEGEEKAEILYNIANVHLHMENYDLSLQFFEESLKIYLEKEDKVNVSEVLHNIASVYEAKKEMAKAISSYKEALEKIIEVYGPTHEYVAAVLNNIGVLYKQSSHREIALDYYKKALEINKKVLGEHHESTRRTLNNINEI